MTRKEIVFVPGISESLVRHKVPFSAAVRANGFVFVSGMPPMDPATGDLLQGDIRTQTAAALDAVRHCLEAAGSSLAKVVSTRIYCVNAAWFPAINEVYARYFPADPPTRTFVTVGSWPLPFDVEVEAVALE
ncbi:MAG TPA: RidA family protein [Burkholderiaceae bacterium]|jgi:2-iminobutanoate/2-iminopropanoate deaminase|nr:RidA family protein [Burkholderiaceae bacterium]